MRYTKLRNPKFDWKKSNKFQYNSMSKHLNDKYFSNFYDGFRQQIQNFNFFIQPIFICFFILLFYKFFNFVSNFKKILKNVNL